MEEKQTDDRFVTYWIWVFRGAGDLGPGYRRVVEDRWLFFDLFLATILTFCLDKPFSSVAGAVIVPLCGVFIGISLAWVGSSYSTLDSDELRLMGSFHEGGYREYPFILQTAVLIFLTAIVLWGVVGTGILDPLFRERNTPWYWGMGVCLFGSVSLCVRTCWKMVLFSHYLLISKERIMRMKRESEENEESPKGN